MIVILLASLLPGAQSLVTRRTSFMASVDSEGRFETLEECEKAYAELLGKLAEEDPAALDDGPAAEVNVTVANDTTPGPTAAPTAAPTKPLLSGEVGEMDKAAAKPAYRPPIGGTGVPSESEGWDYLEHGDDWGASCKGDGQSPIDIEKYIDIGGQTKTFLWFDYFADHTLTAESKAPLTNDGHGLFFNDANVDMGFVKLGTEEFQTAEYFFHAPSEHSIDGQVFPLEVQILHHDGSKKLAVSILFKYGPSNEFLASLMNVKLPVWEVTKKGASIVDLYGNNTDSFNLEHLLPMSKTHPGGDMTFYNYEGSLTAPPCTKGIDWWVTSAPMEATKEEIEHIRSAIVSSESSKHGNNRNVQPLGSRKVLIGHTGLQHHFKNHGHLTKDYAPPRGYSSQDTPWKPAESTESA